MSVLVALVVAAALLVVAPGRQPRGAAEAARGVRHPIGTLVKSRAEQKLFGNWDDRGLRRTT